MVPFGVTIVPRCTVQKYGMTVPLGAFAGIWKLFVPENGPVSKDTPFTEPSLNVFRVDSLVTEWGIVSSLMIVTVAPGGTRRLRGKYSNPKMVMEKPGFCGGGAAVMVLALPHAIVAAAKAATRIARPRMRSPWPLSPRRTGRLMVARLIRGT
jgi:hypothetical protein